MYFLLVNNNQTDNQHMVLQNKKIYHLDMVHKHHQHKKNNQIYMVYKNRQGKILDQQDI